MRTGASTSAARCSRSRVKAQAKPRLVEGVRRLVETLCDEGVAEPAAYVGRYKWVTFKSHNAIPDEQLVAYIRNAHALVAAKLPAKERKASDGEQKKKH